MNSLTGLLRPKVAPLLDVPHIDMRKGFQVYDLSASSLEVWDIRVGGRGKYRGVGTVGYTPSVEAKPQFCPVAFFPRDRHFNYPIEQEEVASPTLILGP